MKTATALMFSLILATPVLAGGALTVFGGGFSRDWVTTTGPASSDGTYRPINRQEWNGEVGLALSHTWSPRWSTEGSLAIEQNHMYAMEGISAGNNTSGLLPVNAKVRTIPVDLAMRFRLANDKRWKPYVSAGAHYVKAPDVRVGYTGAPDSNGFYSILTRRPDNRLSAEAGAGLTVMLTSRFGVRADVNRLLRSDDSEFDPVNRATFGLEWNF